MYPSFIVCLLL